MIVRNLAVPLLFCAGLSACAPPPVTETSVPVVQPPIPGLGIPWERFECSAGLGAEITCSDGARILIPPASLVDAEGQTVTGTVELTYRGFNDAAAIFASGIPMQFESSVAGISSPLESAGMFEIRATQGGRPLSVKDGSGIRVIAPSPKADADFVGLYLDESAASGKWIYQGAVPAEVNPVKAEIARDLDSLSILKEQREGLFALNVWGAMDVYVEQKHFEAGKKLQQKLTDDLKQRGMAYYELSAQREVRCAGRKYPASYVAWKSVDGKDLPLGGSWQAEFVALPKNVYRMTLSNWETGAQRIRRVTPVMPLRDVFRESVPEWFENYTSWVEETDRLTALHERTSAFVRSFEVRSFGIHNCDRFTKVDTPYYVKADFVVPSDTALNGAIQEVFFIERDRRSLVRFNTWSWKQMALDTSIAGTFIAILPDDRMGIFTAEQFQQHSWPDREGYDAVPLTFPLRISPNAGSVQELAEIM